MKAPQGQIPDAIPVSAGDDAWRQAVLKQRAARLAARQPHRQVERGDDVLVFEVQGELAGVRAADCREVVRVENLAPVPDALDGLLGLLNVQNELVCLMDIRSLVWPALDGSSKDFSTAIFLRHPTLRMAIACDVVQGVQEITRDHLDESGVFRVGSRFASMLYLSILLAPFETAEDANQP